MRTLTDNGRDLYRQVSVRMWDMFPKFFTQGPTYWWKTQGCMWPLAQDIEDELL